jgi:hypothetical protein
MSQELEEGTGAQWCFRLAMSRHFQQFQGEGHLFVAVSAVFSFPAPGQYAQMHTHTYKSLTQFPRNGAARDTNFSDAEMVSAFTLSGPLHVHSTLNFSTFLWYTTISLPF